MSALAGTADLDFILAEQGERIEWANGVATYGLVRRGEVIAQDDNGFSIAGIRTTIAVRDGTQPSALQEDAAVSVVRARGIDGLVVREAYVVRAIGPIDVDGLRRITVQAVS